MSKTIYRQILEAGLIINNHHSDLYTPICPESTKIVSQYEFRANVKTFRGNDGKLWYDIPFAYDPYWETVCGY